MVINVNKALLNWLDELDNLKLADYDRLPDIDLYMEQMVSYLDREAHILQKNSEDKQITSSMVNNYVKGKIVPAPKVKRYNKEQVSLLTELIYLKQVLALPEIKQVFDTEYSQKNYREEYNKYLSINRAAIKEAVNLTNENLISCKENDTKDLTDLALSLAAKANAYATISKRILYLLNILKYVNEDANLTQQEGKEKEE
ncbi:MAG: DUF1836 domain-containing protein [Acholeplasmatales bacterium]|jgi:hypothetical protein|nr:DUF1836 domain-containing protein [Acholeplasmatales bacterium]